MANCRDPFRLLFFINLSQPIALIDFNFVAHGTGKQALSSTAENCAEEPRPREYLPPTLLSYEIWILLNSLNLDDEYLSISELAKNCKDPEKPLVGGFSGDDLRLTGRGRQCAAISGEEVFARDLDPG